MLKSVEEEINISDNLWSDSQFSSLRAQMETDYKFWAEYDYKVPKKHGKWENVSDNSPKVLMNKIIGLLSASWTQIYIPSNDQDRLHRKEIAKTEQVAIGSIAMANRALTSRPLGKSIQDSISFFAPMRGGTAVRVWCYEKDGKMIPDIRVYDVLNCTFNTQRFEYRYYEEPDYLNYEYGIKLNNSSKKTLCREIWYRDEWGVLVEDKFVKKYKTNLNYMPIRVATCGSVPAISSETFTDTLKHAFVSAYFNNRELYDNKSKMLSVLLTRGLEAGKIKIVGKYDSSYSQGEIPKELSKLGYSGDDTGDSGGDGRNELIMLDTAKGQEFVNTVAPPPDNQLLDSYRIFEGKDVLGSVDPIAWGQLNSSGASGALAAELRSSALEFMIPFRKNLEENMAWIAEEVIRQYKNQDFSTTRFSGKSDSRERFSVEISPEEITDEETFECELVIDRLRDEAQELGMAIQKVQSGLSSRKTAMVKHNIVEDPDAEMDRMKAELAEQDPVMRYRYWAYKFEDDGTEEGKFMAQYCMYVSQQLMLKTMNGELNPPVMQDRGMNNPGVTPQTEIGNIASQVR